MPQYFYKQKWGYKNMRKVIGRKNADNYELNLTLTLDKQQLLDRKQFIESQISGMEREISRLTNLKAEHEEELAAIEELSEK